MNDCKNYNDQMDLFESDPWEELDYNLSIELHNAVCEKQLIIANLATAMGLSEPYIRGVLDNPLPAQMGFVSDICEALDKKLVITLVDK